MGFCVPFITVSQYSNACPTLWLVYIILFYLFLFVYIILIPWSKPEAQLNFPHFMGKLTET